MDGHRGWSEDDPKMAATDRPSGGGGKDEQKWRRMGDSSERPDEEYQRNFQQASQFKANPGDGQSATGFKRDVIDRWLTYVNKDLLFSKVFYFFFFAAFGALFPLLAVYFKQLGMNPIQAGLLIGFRPFVEFVSGPFWAGVVDRTKRGKHILIFSLICWVTFTVAIAFVKPSATACIFYNSTDTILQEPYNRHKRDVTGGTSPNMQHPSNMFSANEVDLDFLSTDGHVRAKRGDIGKSPIRLKPGDVANRGEADVKGLVSPRFTTIVYKETDVQHAFFGLLILLIIGEFLSSPAITLMDAVTLFFLGEDTDNYGRQRMFGSLGWGLAMFFVGLSLDHSTSFPDHPCAVVDRGEKNYVICFAVFSVFMCCALVTATQIRFVYDGQKAEIQLAEIKEKIKDSFIYRLTTGGKRVDRGKLVTDDESVPYDSTTGQYQKQIPTNPNNFYNEGSQQQQHQQQQQHASHDKKPLNISLDAQHDMVTDATKRSDGPQEIHIDPKAFFGKWRAVFRLLATPKYGTVLFVAWFMGFGVGVIFTFLFWHLQDLGGSPTLFGLASVFNHVSELLAYFMIRKFIATYGHIKVLYMGLLGNVARFLYISWLRNPMWVLPFEFIQGLTHAAVWAACCSYITQAMPQNLRMSAQGILQGLHHGLGRGCGAVFGGILVHQYGSDVAFRAYGVTCIFVLLGYFGINYYLFGKSHLTMTGVGHEPHQLLEEGTHLAPHGVPSNPIAKTLSSHMIADIANQHDPQAYQGPGGYGATEEDADGFLSLGRSRIDPSYGQQRDQSAGYTGGNPYSGQYEQQSNQRVVMGNTPAFNTAPQRQQNENKVNPLFDYQH